MYIYCYVLWVWRVIQFICLCSQCNLNLKKQVSCEMKFSAVFVWNDFYVHWASSHLHNNNNIIHSTMMIIIILVNIYYYWAYYCDMQQCRQIKANNMVQKPQETNK